MIYIKVIGITGKTGCGKSTISGYLEKKLDTAEKIDVDMLAKKIYSENSCAFKEVVECFGNKICKNDMEIDYPSLAREVFSSCMKMDKLNNIMLPLIRDKVYSEIKKRRNLKFLIIDAAVLFDAGIENLCDVIIQVKSYKKNRMAFLAKSRPDICNDDIAQRIKNQKIKIIKNKIDFTLNNNSTIDLLYKKTDKIIKNIENNK